MTRTTAPETVLSGESDSTWKRDCNDCGVCVHCTVRRLQHAKEQNQRAVMAQQQEEHLGGQENGNAEKALFEMYMQYLGDPTPGNPNHPEREQIRRMYINGARDFILTAKNAEYAQQVKEKVAKYSP